MLVSAKGEYVAGGVVMPIYRGNVTVSFHVSDDIEEDDLQREARGRLKRKVADKSLIDQSMIRVREISIEREPA